MSKFKLIFPMDFKLVIERSFNRIIWKQLIVITVSILGAWFVFFRSFFLMMKCFCPLLTVMEYAWWSHGVVLVPFETHKVRRVSKMKAGIRNNRAVENVEQKLKHRQSQGRPFRANWSRSARAKQQVGPKVLQQETALLFNPFTRNNNTVVIVAS
jgi:hypothetical protein